MILAFNVFLKTHVNHFGAFLNLTDKHLLKTVIVLIGQIRRWQGLDEVERNVMAMCNAP